MIVYERSFCFPAIRVRCCGSARRPPTSTVPQHHRGGLVGGDALDHAAPIAPVKLACAPAAVERGCGARKGRTLSPSPLAAAASASLSYSLATRSSLNFCFSSIQRRSAIAAVATARSCHYFAANSDTQIQQWPLVAKQLELRGGLMSRCHKFVGRDRIAAYLGSCLSDFVAI